MRVFWLAESAEPNLIQTCGKARVQFDLIRSEESDPHVPAVDLVIVNANRELGPRSQRDGLKWLLRRRRDCRLLAPALVYSFECLETLRREHPLLSSVGVQCVRLPLSPNEFHQLIAIPRSPLTEEDLASVIRWDCGLQEEWRIYAHRIGNLIRSQEANRLQTIVDLVDAWHESVKRFAPDQIENILAVRTLLAASPRRLDVTELGKALERLDDGLQNRRNRFTTGLTLLGDEGLLPRRPPRGYSKVLVADDAPQDFLINSLSSVYGYSVLPQCWKLDDAKRSLDNDGPEVVLADYYFKRSSRDTESPDKAVGEELIRYALSPKEPANRDRAVPIVLVTSKAILRSETEIRDGAINCSGANRATNPAYIHRVIWEQARLRGVTEAENLGQEWTLEHTCRQRLDQYGKYLPRLITQWGEFREMVRETLRLLRLLSQSERIDDRELVDLAIASLDTSEVGEDYAMKQVLEVFARTELVHRRALQAPHSETKKAVRNILHARIEQFSSVTGAVTSLLGVLPEVSRDLMSLPDYARIGRQLNETLSGFSETEPLTGFLARLNTDVELARQSLPEVPPPRPSPSKATKRRRVDRVEIVVVEDNPYWRDHVVAAIEKTRALLADTVVIDLRCYDNAADALSSIPTSRRSFAIDGTDTGQTTTIAIVDICIPKDREHADRIRAAARGLSDQLDIPHVTHGLDLIRRLSSYQYNIPLIVFSTVDALAERRVIGSWGVPDEDFLSKEFDAESALTRALTRKIQGGVKYVVRRYDGSEPLRFWINGVEISLTPELLETFRALYELCQRTGQRSHSAAAIAESRWQIVSEEGIARIQSQMYRIRREIFEQLRMNHFFVDIRELIKTRKSANDEFIYELNADLTPEDEEEDYEDDLERYQNERCRVMVVENDRDTVAQMREMLESVGYEVRSATNVKDAVEMASQFLPHVVSLDLQIPRTREEADSGDSAGDENAGLEAWDRIRTMLSKSTVGVVVPTVNSHKNYLIARATQMGIPVRSFVSKGDPNWLSALLRKVGNERARVFRGELLGGPDDVHEPLVEILEGSDLSLGVLHLEINGVPFTMRSGPVSKIIGHLLANPKTLQSLNLISQAAGRKSGGSENDFKNWTKRIREVITTKWLRFSNALSKPSDTTQRLLEYSAKGMQINVQVIDRRAPENRASSQDKR